MWKGRADNAHVDLVRERNICRKGTAASEERKILQSWKRTSNEGHDAVIGANIAMGAYFADAGFCPAAIIIPSVPA
jgi:hypothetical protein